MACTVVHIMFNNDRNYQPGAMQDSIRTDHLGQPVPSPVAPVLIKMEVLLYLQLLPYLHRLVVVWSVLSMIISNRHCSLQSDCLSNPGIPAPVPHLSLIPSGPLHCGTRPLARLWSHLIPSKSVEALWQHNCGMCPAMGSLCSQLHAYMLFDHPSLCALDLYTEQHVYSLHCHMYVRNDSVNLNVLYCMYVAPFMLRTCVGVSSTHALMFLPSSATVQYI